MTTRNRGRGDEAAGTGVPNRNKVPVTCGAASKTRAIGRRRADVDHFPGLRTIFAADLLRERSTSAAEARQSLKDAGRVPLPCGSRTFPVRDRLPYGSRTFPAYEAGCRTAVALFPRKRPTAARRRKLERAKGQRFTRGTVHDGRSRQATKPRRNSSSIRACSTRSSRNSA
jgi:hypothetical protein